MKVELVLAVWLIGVGFLAGELFVPGVVMGAIGCVLVLGSLIAMFLSGGPLAGGGLTLVSLIAGAIIIKVASSRVTHRHRLDAESGYVGTDDNTGLIGQEGVTATTLRPGGFATIGGKRVDVVTNGEMIEQGVPVEVVAVEGNRIQVAPKLQA